MNKVIFTDLDHCLLNEAYQYAEAKDALHALHKKNIPLVFVSSKTKAEIEDINATFPFRCSMIYENGGGAIIYPSTHLSFGCAYQELVTTLTHHANLLSIEIEGFHSMSLQRLQKLTRLSDKQALLAKARLFDEPFLIHSDHTHDMLAKQLLPQNISITKGDLFYHAKGLFTKATPIPFFRKHYPTAQFIGIGSGLNDKEFLKEMDLPILMPSCPFTIKGAQQIDQGPQGWANAVLKLCYKSL